MRKMAAETKAVYEKSLVEIQEQLQQNNVLGQVSAFHNNAGGAVRDGGGGGIPPSPRAQKISRLSSENKNLQEDLQDMKEKYQQLVRRQQQARRVRRRVRAPPRVRRA